MNPQQSFIIVDTTTSSHDDNTDASTTTTSFVASVNPLSVGQQGHSILDVDNTRARIETPENNEQQDEADLDRVMNDDNNSVHQNNQLDNDGNNNNNNVSVSSSANRPNFDLSSSHREMKMSHNTADAFMNRKTALFGSRTTIPTSEKNLGTDDHQSGEHDSTRSEPGFYAPFLIYGMHDNVVAATAQDSAYSFKFALRRLVATTGLGGIVFAVLFCAYFSYCAASGNEKACSSNQKEATTATILVVIFIALYAVIFGLGGYVYSRYDNKISDGLARFWIIGGVLVFLALNFCFPLMNYEPAIFNCLVMAILAQVDYLPAILCVISIWYFIYVYNRMFILDSNEETRFPLILIEPDHVHLGSPYFWLYNNVTNGPWFLAPVFLLYVKVVDFFILLSTASTDRLVIDKLGPKLVGRNFRGALKFATMYYDKLLQKRAELQKKGDLFQDDTNDAGADPHLQGVIANNNNTNHNNNPESSYENNKNSKDSGVLAVDEDFFLPQHEFVVPEDAKFDAEGRNLAIIPEKNEKQKKEHEKKENENENDNENDGGNKNDTDNKDNKVVRKVKLVDRPEVSFASQQFAASLKSICETLHESWAFFPRELAASPLGALIARNGKKKNSDGNNDLSVSAVAVPEPERNNNGENNTNNPDENEENESKNENNSDDDDILGASSTIEATVMHIEIADYVALVEKYSDEDNGAAAAAAAAAAASSSSAEGEFTNLMRDFYSAVHDHVHLHQGVVTECFGGTVTAVFAPSVLDDSGSDFTVSLACCAALVIASETISAEKMSFIRHRGEKKYDKDGRCRPLPLSRLSNLSFHIAIDHAQVRPSALACCHPALFTTNSPSRPSSSSSLPPHSDDQQKQYLYGSEYIHRRHQPYLAEEIAASIASLIKSFDSITTPTSSSSSDLGGSNKKAAVTAILLSEDAATRLSNEVDLCRFATTDETAKQSFAGDTTAEPSSSESEARHLGSTNDIMTSSSNIGAQQQHHRVKIRLPPGQRHLLPSSMSRDLIGNPDSVHSKPDISISSDNNSNNHRHSRTRQTTRRQRIPLLSAAASSAPNPYLRSPTFASPFILRQVATVSSLASIALKDPRVSRSSSSTTARSTSNSGGSSNNSGLQLLPIINNHQGASAFPVEDESFSVFQLLGVIDTAEKAITGEDQRNIMNSLMTVSLSSMDNNNKSGQRTNMMNNLADQATSEDDDDNNFYDYDSSTGDDVGQIMIPQNFSSSSSYDLLGQRKRAAINNENIDTNNTKNKNSKRRRMKTMYDHQHGSEEFSSPFLLDRSLLNKICANTRVIFNLASDIGDDNDDDDGINRGLKTRSTDDDDNGNEVRNYNQHHSGKTFPLSSSSAPIFSTTIDATQIQLLVASISFLSQVLPVDEISVNALVKWSEIRLLFTSELCVPGARRSTTAMNTASSKKQHADDNVNNHDNNVELTRTEQTIVRLCCELVDEVKYASLSPCLSPALEKQGVSLSFIEELGNNMVEHRGGSIPVEFFGSVGYNYYSYSSSSSSSSSHHHHHHQLASTSDWDCNDEIPL